MQRTGRKYDEATIEQIIAQYLDRKKQGLPIKPLLDKYSISRQNISYWLPYFADKVKAQAQKKPAIPAQPTSKIEGAWPQEAVEAINELKSVIKYLEKKIRELEEPQTQHGFKNLTTNPG